MTADEHHLGGSRRQSQEGTGRDPTLDEMLEASTIHQLTPAEIEAQRASWVRGMTARCEHVEVDFEQCGARAQR